MKTDSPEFRTAKRHRVYKRSRVVDGQLVYADNYTIRVKQDGRTAYFHLGTVKRDASTKADEIMAFLAVGGNTLDEALVKYSEPHKNRALREVKAPAPKVDELTVGGMVELYTAISGHLSPVTVKNNIAALKHVAAGILGLEKLGVDQTNAQRTDWLAKVNKFSIADFTIPKIETFRQAQLRACGTDHEKRGKTSTTLNSYMRSCRSIFATKLLPQYHGLPLPEPLPFRGIQALQEPSHRYHSKIDIGPFIELAKAELYAADKDAWIAFLLCIAAALRREEADKLMWEQVDFKTRRIWIRTTKFFRPKAKNSDDCIDITEGVAAYLQEYRDAGENAQRLFVLPGREVTGKLRCLKVFRSLYKWIRSKGIDDQKPVHTLRKEAGSLVFQKSGSIDRAASFLRNDPRVAREHYIGRKERLELELPGL